MSKIDEFESLFKSASKPVYHVDPVRIKKISIVVDQDLDALEPYIRRAEDFLKVLNSVDHTIEIKRVAGEAFDDVGQLLDILQEQPADLICTYRNLHAGSKHLPFSLGEFVDVLTQATDVPILLLPRPEEIDDRALVNTDRVMLMTDHLAGDSKLVTYAAMFTQDHGELTLAHVEDEQTFERYMHVVGRIQTIDTDSAREEIREQLLKEPRDYIESCEAGLHEAGLPVSVKPIVTFGHHLIDYKQLIEENETDLLVLHTKDEDQLAMHGLAYPVTVEMRGIPLLLI